MNSEQKQEIQRHIQHFNEEFAKIKNRTKVVGRPGSQIGILFENLLTKIKTLIDRLDQKINSDNWLYLPIDLPKSLVENVSFTTRFAIAKPTNLIQLVETIVLNLNVIKKDVLDGCEKFLENYLYLVDFSDSMWKNELNGRMASIKEAENKADDLATKTSEELARARSLFEELKNQKNNLDVLRESVVIKVNDADNKNAQLADSIRKYQENGDQVLNDVAQKSRKVSEQIEETRQLMNQANSKLSDINKKSEESLKGVEENLSVTNENVKKIKDMMGLIGGGVLGNSFSQRKKNLGKKAVVWLIVSFILFLGAIAWICVVFTSLSANTGIVWANILINVVKSSLAVFAFGYALNEYGKERNLQEEYAFKESVALTLAAFLNQLDSCNIEEKKKLLVGTVEKLYTKPAISSKEYKLGDTKEIADLLKPLVDVLKPITDKVKD